MSKKSWNTNIYVKSFDHGDVFLLRLTGGSVLHKLISVRFDPYVQIRTLF